MIGAVFAGLERFFGEGLALWAVRAHAVSLGIVVLALAIPPARWFWARWKAARGAGWAPQWICPACGHTNAHADGACAKCRAGGGTSPGRWFRGLPGLGWLAGGARATAFVLRATGYVFFYGMTLFAANRFRFFQFDQKPLQELLGAAAMVLLVLVLYYARRVVSWKWGSPVSRATDFLVMMSLAGAFLILWILWAAAPFVRGEALAVLAVTPDGQLRVWRPRRRVGRVVENPETARWIVPLQYARFSWPLVGVDQTFLVRVGTHTVMSWAGARLVKFGSDRWDGDSPWRPRLTTARHTLEAAAPGLYEIHPSSVGEGVVLTPREAVQK
ncbi:MAG: hypothetical protein IPN65_09930 [Elusimicrobia bacterium]|jgi:hypothetical protein|nr:hypothetical protein [Elusimicrobiota bacterium]MBK7544804.1 hypothetical protein [Elusimicrobiota bacterium]MBK7574316.1 hypothetical protein [Elusimicrobiota bacterium]MBK7688320.1 hypothetical protein [Elusimicrobiota bacterium]MBK8126463.1 hypothetical protein [Elusimicrobiota bacterium]